MILIAGPYRSGTGDDPAWMEANLRKLEAVGDTSRNGNLCTLTKVFDGWGFHALASTAYRNENFQEIGAKIPIRDKGSLPDKTSRRFSGYEGTA